MSNFAKSFKDGITRLARKEAKAVVKAACPEHRRRATRSTVANLKQRVTALEKDVRRLTKLLSTLSPQRLSAPAGDLSSSSPAADQKARITGKGMRSLRRKLGLNAAQLGRLLGVTRFAVYAWEERNGPLRLRPTTRAAILAIRTLGAREAKARLQALAKK
jgi:DNA-binding transcriptional regulator YiaG